MNKEGRRAVAVFIGKGLVERTVAMLNLYRVLQARFYGFGQNVPCLMKGWFRLFEQPCHRVNIALKRCLWIINELPTPVAAIEAAIRSGIGVTVLLAEQMPDRTVYLCSHCIQQIMMIHDPAGICLLNIINAAGDSLTGNPALVVFSGGDV